MQIKRALISVSDKTGLAEFVKGLDSLDIKIISTGGTSRLIKEMGVEVTEVSQYTGFPEMMDGRVKTLHPRVHAGLLALRENRDHMLQMDEYDIPFIDMVVVNLYPFKKTILKDNVTLEEAIENIDIGGPSMLRSAAKNYKSVAVLTSPDQYADVLEQLQNNDLELPEEMLKNMAIEVFRKTSEYDKTINEYLATGERPFAGASQDKVKITLEKVFDLRYGENPHQKAAFYKDTSSQAGGIVDTVQYQGKQLSFNNIMDINAAIGIIGSFEKPAVSIVKHTNPCGAAVAETIDKAYIDALQCDRTSAFGSIIAFNKTVTKETAELILKEAAFIECVIAPGYDDRALSIFEPKKNVRVIKYPFGANIPGTEKNMKKVIGGMLIQDLDSKTVSKDELKIVTQEKPGEEIINSLLFAWEVTKHVKSNAILLAQGTKTVGIGAGQMSRVDSVITAIRKAGDKAKNAVLASDAFFPMPDSIEAAHAAGISAIIQPGGSIRDAEVIEACNKHKIPMVFTGIRHFSH